LGSIPELQAVLAEATKAPSGAVEWYYLDGDKTCGPKTAEEIQNMLSSGSIPASTWLFREGMTDWAKAKSMQEFTAYASPGNNAAFPIPPPKPSSSNAPRSMRVRLVAGCIAGVLMLGIAGWCWGEHMRHIKKAEEARLATMAQQRNAERERLEKEKIAREQAEAEEKARDEAQQKANAEAQQQAKEQQAKEQARLAEANGRVKHEWQQKVNAIRAGEMNTMDKLLKPYLLFFLQSHPPTSADEQRLYIYWTNANKLLSVCRGAIASADPPVSYTETLHDLFNGIDPATGLLISIKEPIKTTSSQWGETVRNINRRLNTLAKDEQYPWLGIHLFAYNSTTNVWVYRFVHTNAYTTHTSEADSMFLLTDLDSGSGKRYQQNGYWHIVFSTKNSAKRVLTMTRALSPQGPSSGAIPIKVADAVDISVKAGGPSAIYDVDQVMLAIAQLISAYSGPSNNGESAADDIYSGYVSPGDLEALQLRGLTHVQAVNAAAIFRKYGFTVHEALAKFDASVKKRPEGDGRDLSNWSSGELEDLIKLLRR
jgi:hypothetical protein